MCRINPRVDFAFKKLFGSEENKDILISLINAIVSEKDQVVDLELQNPYNAKNYQNDKLSILDIKAKDSNNHWYNIEMQVADQKWYDKRALYYWAKIYNEQVRAGINYDQLTKTISINILNFNCLDEENYHNVYHILNDKTHSLLVDDLEMHFIELEKYDEKLVSILDRWVNFLKKAENYSQKYMPKELSDEPKIQKALEVLETINFSDDERESYEDRLKVLRDRINIIKTAEYKGRIAGLEEGRKEGLEEGRKEGLEEGRKEGIDEGKSESKIEIAKNLLELMDDPKISTITGLGIELIQKLRQDHAN